MQNQGWQLGAGSKTADSDSPANGRGSRGSGVIAAVAEIYASCRLTDDAPLFRKIRAKNARSTVGNCADEATLIARNPASPVASAELRQVNARAAVWRE